MQILCRILSTLIEQNNEILSLVDCDALPKEAIKLIRMGLDAHFSNIQWLAEALAVSDFLE